MTTPIKDTSDSDTHCSHCITYEGLLYSTLDRTSPDDVVLGTQSEFLELPNGWNVAKWSEGLVHNVIAKYPWGTHCLVLSSGSAYYTALAETTQANGSPGDKFNSSQGLLVVDGLRFKPYTKHLRVLIYAPSSILERGYCQQALSGMWEAKDFTDCEVVCHGGSVRCHRAVLAQASPVFKQMLCGEMVEAKTQRIPLESVDMEVVLALLNFAYTGKVTCDPVHFPALTKLSDFYQMSIFTEVLCQRMLETLDTDTMVPTARVLRSMRDRPRIAPYWSQLARKARQSTELTASLMLGV